jgi:hypothetical protein
MHDVCDGLPLRAIGACENFIPFHVDTVPTKIGDGDEQRGFRTIGRLLENECRVLPFERPILERYFCIFPSLVLMRIRDNRRDFIGLEIVYGSEVFHHNEEKNATADFSASQYGRMGQKSNILCDA